MNIPIYRAKKIDSDKYVEGFYKNVLYFIDKHIITSLVNISGVENNIQKTNLWDYKNYEIDPTTLAIHFPDMLDSQGNKIFASLSENRKGGDILESKWFNIDSGLTVKIEAVKWSKSGFCFTQDGYNISRYEYKKIIGIQK